MDLDLFKVRYKEFAEKFDEIHEKDGFDCEKLHQLSIEFLQENRSNFMDKIPFGSVQNSPFPNGNVTQIWEEDLNIMDKNKLIQTSDNDDKEEAEGNGLTQKSKSVTFLPVVSEEAQICADIYRRLAQATYLLTTLHKLRNKTDNPKDRFEAFTFARYAIRYNSRDFKAITFYSLTLGWYLDIVGPGLEKARMGRLFYCSLIYNISLNDKNGLAHHLFGRYCFNVSNLSWIERTLAGKLFDPSEIAYTLKDAEEAFCLGHSLDNKLVSHGLWMARTSQAQKKGRDQIQEWVELGLKAKSREPINDIERAQLEEFKRKGKY